MVEDEMDGFKVIMTPQNGSKEKLLDYLQNEFFGPPIDEIEVPEDSPHYELWLEAKEWMKNRQTFLTGGICDGIGGGMFSFDRFQNQNKRKSKKKTHKQKNRKKEGTTKKRVN